MVTIDSIVEKINKMKDYHVVKFLFDIMADSLDNMHDFDKNMHYFKGQIIHVYDPVNNKHGLYTCIPDILPPGEFDPSKWTKVSIDPDTINGIINDINSIKSMLPSIVRSQMLHAYPTIKDSTLLNTSTLMEYSMDSTDGLDGTWKSCTFPNTIVIFPFKEHKIYVREKGNVGNTVLAAWIAAPLQAPVVNITPGDDFTPTVISGVSSLMEYSLDNGLTWKDAVVNLGDSMFIAEKGQFTIRFKGDELTLPSLSTPMVELK